MAFCGMARGAQFAPTGSWVTCMKRRSERLCRIRPRVAVHFQLPRDQVHDPVIGHAGRGIETPLFAAVVGQ